ncbi:hypothetical protein N656DRAFT_802965 [Canariomyces notabilis]|uniref:Uncharacterized protein n=1 Tax=Canariomyces notabilis TaxID=2074819 RepID=A0AAN6T7P0_9PEZI|nr:hypothetical protein N656DRAFT_802965 [Canariomyces arenarius]
MGGMPKQLYSHQQPHPTHPSWNRERRSHTRIPHAGGQANEGHQGRGRKWNWFKNRRAKEMRMRKNAEFEAQQGRERAASESKSSKGVSSGTFGEDDEEVRAESDSPVSSTSESAEHEAAKSSETPETDADCFVQVQREASPSISIGPSGPRSPFAMDLTKEALLQSPQGAQAPRMPSMNSATGSLSQDGGHGLGENSLGANSPEEEQCYPYGSLGSVGGLKEAPEMTNLTHGAQLPPKQICFINYQGQLPFDLRRIQQRRHTQAAHVCLGYDERKRKRNDNGSGGLVVPRVQCGTPAITNIGSSDTTSPSTVAEDRLFRDPGSTPASGLSNWGGNTGFIALTEDQLQVDWPFDLDRGAHTMPPLHGLPKVTADITVHHPVDGSSNFATPGMECEEDLEGFALGIGMLYGY